MLVLLGSSLYEKQKKRGTQAEAIVSGQLVKGQLKNAQRSRLTLGKSYLQIRKRSRIRTSYSFNLIYNIFIFNKNVFRQYLCN
jgi:hypothetical protein